MDRNNLLLLQNGSDIRGVAMEGIPGQPVNLTREVASMIAVSFANWLGNKLSKPTEDLKISIGRDPRLSGPDLTQAIIQGLLSKGCQVVDYGLCTTPAMFMSVQLDGRDGAIMITASHLPWNRNGMKFFYNGGGLEKQDITNILDHTETGPPKIKNIRGSHREKDFLTTYAGWLVDFIRKETAGVSDDGRPLEGLKILVDAGNGSGGFFESLVLKPLGADTSGSLFLEPDGHFPNHAPNPENSEALKSLEQTVLKNQANLGIIFDTDVDRAAVVDASGKAVNRNSLIALIAAIVLEKFPDSWVVTDSITSDGLTWFIEKKLGGHHHRFKRGYRNVINEAIRLNGEGKECHLAIETSGHAALKENYFLDDGAFLIARILIRLARISHQPDKSLSTLIQDLPVPAEERELRFKLEKEDFAEYGKRILNDLPAFVQKQAGWTLVHPNFEGVRVACDPGSGNGWFLLRLSLHDPVMPLNIESNEKGGVEKIMGRLKSFLDGYDKLH